MIMMALLGLGEYFDRLLAFVRVQLAWLVGQVTGWFQGMFASLRAMGDSELASIVGALKTAIPSSTAVWDNALEWIPIANHYFPLSESIALLSAYGGLWATVVGYRLVKSWIPFVK